jgi:aconitate decarboxylase
MSAVQERHRTLQSRHRPCGPTGRLATTTLEDVPAAVQDHAKHPVHDGLACALVNAQLPVSRKGVKAITGLEDAGTAALID